MSQAQEGGGAELTNPFATADVDEVNDNANDNDSDGSSSGSDLGDMPDFSSFITEGYKNNYAEGEDGDAARLELTTSTISALRFPASVELKSGISEEELLELLKGQRVVQRDPVVIGAGVGNRSVDESDEDPDSNAIAKNKTESPKVTSSVKTVSKEIELEDEKTNGKAPKVVSRMQAINRAKNKMKKNVIKKAKDISTNDKAEKSADSRPTCEAVLFDKTTLLIVTPNEDSTLDVIKVIQLQNWCVVLTNHSTDLVLENQLDEDSTTLMFADDHRTKGRWLNSIVETFSYLCASQRNATRPGLLHMHVVGTTWAAVLGGDQTRLIDMLQQAEDAEEEASKSVPHDDEIDYRAMLSEVFQRIKNNTGQPAKSEGKLDELLMQYKHDESTLIAKLSNKYKVKNPLTEQAIAASFKIEMIPKYLRPGFGSSASVDGCDESGASLLHYAALKGDLEMVDLLLTLGAQAIVYDNNFQSPVHFAAILPSVAVVDRLFHAGCDLSACDMKDRTALFTAVEACSNSNELDTYRQEQFAQVISKLIALGCDAELRDLDGNTVLDFACLNGAHVQSVSALLGTEVRVCPPNRSNMNRTSLHLACLRLDPNPKVIDELLSWGALANAMDDNNDTPLNLLLRGEPKHGSSLPMMTPNRREAAVAFVSSGANLMLQNLQGDTPAGAAAAHKLTDVFQRAAEEWKARTAPQIASVIAERAPNLLLMAMSSESPTWEVDAKVSKCFTCVQPFSLTKRRHHCRACGKIFCAPCSDKRFTLFQPDAPTRTVSARVCDTCFRLACRMTEANFGKIPDAATATNTTSQASAGFKSSGRALDAVLGGGTSESNCANQSTNSASVGNSETEVRQALFGSAVPDSSKADGVKHVSSADRAREKQQEARAEQSQRVQQTLAETRRRMAERQEQAEDVRDKASKLNEGAADFASLATKLRKQQEGEKCVVS